MTDVEVWGRGVDTELFHPGRRSQELRHGENGLACPEGDVGAMARAMVSLAGDYGLARRLARGARRTAERLTWDGELDRLEQSYREVCDGRPQARSGNQQVTEVPSPRSLSA